MDPFRAVSTAIIVVVALALGTLVVDEFTSVNKDIEDGDVVNGYALLGAPGQYYSVNDNYGIKETVVDSRGYAVNLSGRADSYVTTDNQINIATDDNWTVSVWARPDAEVTSGKQTAVSIDGRIVISYDATASNWTAYYYDTGSTNSYRVNVSAPDSPGGNFSNIIVTRNDSTLSIYRNNTLGESKSVTGENTVTADVNSTNWDGRLEELRTFNEALNNSKRDRVYSEPVRAISGVERTSRIMFDQPRRKNQLVFFANAQLQQSNVSFSDGLSGHEMQSKSLFSSNADYEWSNEGPQLKPLAGGGLDGAPVAYVEYTFKTEYADPDDMFGMFTGLASLLPLLMIAVVIMAYVQRL